MSASAAMIALAVVTSAAGISPLREFEGFAVATCLIQAGDPYLKDQGHRWAAITVQGGRVPLTRLAPLEAAVKARVAQGGMVVARDEASPTGDRPLPLVFCARVVDAPAVRSAIRRLAAPRRRPDPRRPDPRRQDLRR